MTHFSPDPLSADTSLYLSQLYKVVNATPQGKDRYDIVLDLWKKRKDRTGDELKWAEIEQKLTDKHPLTGICQYCEFDRTAATEHFFPKKHFPLKAFDWNNYLLVCYRCNSTYKGDKFAVFNPLGSSTVFDLPNTKKTYPIPPTEDAVLINPRTDDPTKYLMIDLGSGMFVPTPGVDSRGKEKAVYTYTLLHLNSDANLLRYRKKAIGSYLQKLKVYVAIKQAIDFPGLIAASPIGESLIVLTTSFAQEQARLLQVIQADLCDDLFSSAWQEIKQQKALFPEISALFAAATEAETW